MNVAYCDCRTPRCSRSSDFVNPSNSRLPPPSTTGATTIVSSSTRSASSAGRVLRAANRLLHAGEERERAAVRLVLRAVRHDEERQSPRVLVAPVARSLVRPAPPDDRADTRDGLLEPRSILTGRLSSRFGVVRPRRAENPVV